MSKAKKRDSRPLYVPKGMKTRDTTNPEDVLVDGISDLSLKSVKPTKESKKASTPNGKIQPVTEVPDSWESITEFDVINVSAILLSAYYYYF